MSSNNETGLISAKMEYRSAEIIHKIYTIYNSLNKDSRETILGKDMCKYIDDNKHTLKKIHDKYQKEQAKDQGLTS